MAFICIWIFYHFLGQKQLPKKNVAIDDDVLGHKIQQA